MTKNGEMFETVQNLIQTGEAASAMSKMAQFLLIEKRFHELFEVRKIQLRQSLDLPIRSSESTAELPLEKRSDYETGLIAACREIGELLIADGRIREAWVYLQAVDDRPFVKNLITGIQLDDENSDELIEIAINEGVAPLEGFSWLLEKLGTCNAITTYDSYFMMYPLEIRQGAAEQLARQLHRELKANLTHQIHEQQPDATIEDSIAEIVDDRPWLFSGNLRHVDESHLASVVRICRIVEDSESAKLARDLAAYGLQMNSEYSAEGDPPFASLYEDSQLFYDALLGERVDEAKIFFGEKARNCEPDVETTACIEWYIFLLNRLGQQAEAINVSLELLPGASPQMNIAPNLFELAQNQADWNRIHDYLREQDRLLDYGVALIEGQSSLPAQ